MAHYSLWEPLVDALVTRLQTNLAATVTEINAATTDGYTITAADPAWILPYPPQPEMLTQVGAPGVPVIGVQAMPATYTDDIGTSLTGHYTLGILCFLADADQKGLVRRLGRQLQAITTVALSGRNLGAAAYGTTLRRVVPGPSIDVQENPRTWISWGCVEINALTAE